MPHHLSCYLVEWYCAELSEETIDRTLAQLSRGVESVSDGTVSDGTSAKVLMILSVPTDDVIFCVFATTSRELVATAPAPTISEDRGQAVYPLEYVPMFEYHGWQRNTH